MFVLVKHLSHRQPRQSRTLNLSMSSRRVKDDETANFAGRRSLRRTLMLSGTCNHEVAFRYLRASPSSSICSLYQFRFEYVTLKDKQAYVGSCNSKRALCEFCLC